MTRQQKKRLKELNKKARHSYLSYAEINEHIELLELDLTRLFKAEKWCIRIIIILSVISVLLPLIIILTK